MISNKDVAKILKGIAAIYEIKEENRFRVSAYNRAADSIEHATSEIKDIWEEGKLEEIPGVGKHIASYLEELFKKRKVKHFEELKKGMPEGLFELLEVPGIGPKRAYKICKNLGVKSVSGLEKAARKGKIRKLEGFGEESEADILRGVGEFKKRSGRLPLHETLPIAEMLIDYLKTCLVVEKADPLGSLRRKVPTVGDIDIAASSKKSREVIDYFTKLALVDHVLDAGEKTSSIVLKNGYQVDLMVQPPESYGALLQHLTGSKLHNIHLRKLANEKRFSLSEYGITPLKKGQKLSKKDLEGEELPQRRSLSPNLIKIASEKDFYGRLGLGFIPPELREDSGEIEAAAKNQLPKLVEISDIKGDLHIHSKFSSDSQSSLEEIARKGKSLGYSYFAISDHHPSMVSKSLNEVISIIRRRNKEIEQISDSLRNIRVIKGLEVSILADNKMALPDEILRELDLVIASIHTAFNQPKEKITERFLSAIKNPNVKIIGHPTGRLLGERESYEADWKEIYKACARHKKAIEINAYPKRMDLPDTMAREAKKYGVKFVINTDAHTVDQMDYMRFGVYVARRGWLEKEDIINTWPWDRVKSWLKIG